jgi:hypothetical protein
MSTVIGFSPQNLVFSSSVHSSGSTNVFLYDVGAGYNLQNICINFYVYILVPG